MKKKFRSRKRTRRSRSIVIKETKTVNKTTLKSYADIVKQK